MIEAKELRIGNWVSHKGSWCYRGENVTNFQWDESDWGASAECLMDLDDALPIPLTDDWAVKFGYENLNEMRVCFVDDCIFDFSIDYTQFSNLKVHEAQNLYFALTGEELTINEL